MVEDAFPVLGIIIIAADQRQGVSASIICKSRGKACRNGHIAVGHNKPTVRDVELVTVRVGDGERIKITAVVGVYVQQDDFALKTGQPVRFSQDKTDPEDHREKLSQ